jgi:hypothetical protein
MRATREAMLMVKGGKKSSYIGLHEQFSSLLGRLL